VRNSGWYGKCHQSYGVRRVCDVLFMRSIDPVIPQIAEGLRVAPTTAALLSTGFTLPYALIQPVLGALADMFSKTRLISISMLILGVTTLVCGLSTNFLKR